MSANPPLQRVSDDEPTPERFARLDEPRFRREVVDQFHYLYYHASAQTWCRTTWLGVPAYKCPLDLWVYQELLVAQRPDVIIETGTADGGSALYLAAICDLIGHGRIYSIDIADRTSLPVHPRVEYLSGSSTSDEIHATLRARIRPGERVLVILDSDHSEAHVGAELERFAPMIDPGGYLIVEDTNINGHPALHSFGPGPMEAVDAFLATHPEFEIDASCEKYFMTFNPRGYLRRVESDESRGRRPSAARAGIDALGPSALLPDPAMLTGKIAALRGEIDALRAAAAERDQYTRGLESALQTIYGSRWWRAAQWYRGLRNLLHGRAKRTR